MSSEEISKSLNGIGGWHSDPYPIGEFPSQKDPASNTDAYYVGRMVRAARRKQGITQSELAVMTGTTKSYISKIENGHIEPGAGLFLRIMSALGLRLETV